ncbi:hypothetical protein BCR39DRAFT_589987 [Naematelia encephala]|uniref:Uncharacterized protein n=1 Tax=Naematelia encephala TaxID=71784 RepID=A0A1Y2ATR5_9TREE|nr:hypothetical protein BCR39DRAFT_589987 [Naematelia encephala]
MPQLCEECQAMKDQVNEPHETPLDGPSLSKDEESETKTTVQPESKPTTSLTPHPTLISEIMIMPAPFLTTDPALATDPIQIAAEQEARIWGLARLQAVLDRLQAETPKQIPLPEDNEEEPVADSSVGEDKEKKKLKKQKQKEKKKEKAEKDKKDLEDYIERNRDRKGKQKEEQGQDMTQPDTNTSQQESEIEEMDTPRPVPLDLPLDADFEIPANYQGPFEPPPIDPNATPAIPTGSFHSDFMTPKGFTPSFLLGETPSPYPSEIGQSPYFPAGHSEEEEEDKDYY